MNSHENQQEVWDEEHKNPKVLLQMDSREPSSGVEKFWKFLQTKNLNTARGLEMGCGKGRNVIWLAEQGVDMYGFDFSPAAIKEAGHRAVGTDAAHVQVQDATKTWNYESDFFDFGIDCFASTDIPSREARAFAAREFHRVLKPGGYLCAYLLSTDDEYHKRMIERAPAEEAHAFYHSTGKFEKTFTEEEIKEQYQEFTIVGLERLEKTAEFDGQAYACKHFWVLFQKS